MICTKCNKEFSDGLNVCPHCQNKMDYIRCPKCWNKLDSDAKECDKCGSNIDEVLRQNKEIAQYKEKTVIDKVKTFPLWLKIAIPAIVVILCVALAVSGWVSTKKAQTKAAELVVEYTEELETYIDEITFIAQIYETDVYSKDWIQHIEAAKTVRRLYEEEIKSIQSSRQNLDYKRKQIQALGIEEFSTMANNAYYTYTDCYTYVINENGKYPNYLKNYKKLLKEFKDINEDMLKKAKDILE